MGSQKVGHNGETNAQISLEEFPIDFFVIHTLRGFSVVNDAEKDVFLEFSCFSIIQWMLEI